MGAAASKRVDDKLSNGIQNALNNKWVPVFMKLNDGKTNVQYASIVGDNIIQADTMVDLATKFTMNPPEATVQNQKNSAAAAPANNSKKTRWQREAEIFKSDQKAAAERFKKLGGIAARGLSSAASGLSSAASSAASFTRKLGDSVTSGREKRQQIGQTIKRNVDGVKRLMFKPNDKPVNLTPTNNRTTFQRLRNKFRGITKRANPPIDYAAAADAARQPSPATPDSTTPDSTTPDSTTLSAPAPPAPAPAAAAATAAPAPLPLRGKLGVSRPPMDFAALAAAARGPRAARVPLNSSINSNTLEQGNSQPDTPVVNPNIYSNTFGPANPFANQQGPANPFANQQGQQQKVKHDGGYRKTRRRRR